MIDCARCENVQVRYVGAELTPTLCECATAPNVAEPWANIDRKGWEAVKRRTDHGEPCLRCRHTHGVHAPQCRLESGCPCAGFVEQPRQAVLPL